MDVQTSKISDNLKKLICVKITSKKFESLFNHIPFLEEYDLKYCNKDKEISKIFDDDWYKLTNVLLKEEFFNLFFDTVCSLDKLYYIYLYRVNLKCNITKKKVKKMVSFFSIAFFNNSICVGKVKYKDNLINDAKKIVKLLIQIKNGVYTKRFFKYIKLYKIILNYTDLYELWENEDKTLIVYETAHSIHKIDLKLLTDCLSSNEELNKIVKLQLYSEKKTLKNNIKYLNDPKFNKLFKELISHHSELENINKKLYWMDVEYKLYKDPPDKQIILDLFKETKRLIKNLLPRRIDLQEEIDSYLDIDILENILNNTNIDEEYLVSRCYYIIEWIKKLQSKKYDILLEKFEKDFKNKFVRKEYYRDIIPFFFNFILESLEQIHLEKNQFINFINKTI